MPASRRLVVWAERGQEALVGDAIRQAELDLAAVGASSTASADALATSLGVERADDLRQTIQREDIDLLWLASPEPIEPDERRLIREIGLPTFSSVPRPVAIGDLMAAPEAADTARFVPLFRRSPGFRAALDILEDFGPRRSICVSIGGAASEGPLIARLFDAMDLLASLAGEIESIDAALAGPRSAVPESPESLHGWLTANIRFTEECCAAIAVSDTAGSWFRRATILGKRGRLHITDASFQWINEEGEPLDTGGIDHDLSPGELIGMQITRLLDNLETPTAAAPPDTARLLGLCEAARLSCRTGQSETPHRLLQMLRKP